MHKRFISLDDAIIALGGVPEPLNEIGYSRKEVPMKEVPGEQPVLAKPFINMNRDIDERNAYVRYLFEIHDYDIRGNWRRKILFALNELEIKAGTVPEIVKVLMKFENSEEDVFKNVTWYASHMSRCEKTIGVRKVNHRNPSLADFSHTMRMTFISSTCMIICWLVIFLINQDS